LKKPLLEAFAPSKLLATLCSPDGPKWQKNEAGNILKTKGRGRGFQKNEAENILKTKQLPKTVGIHKDLIAY
jgi:hypothetical protein